jgi:hypothetical protein
MSDEFKKKLAEIASRVEASKQKTSNAAAEKAADVAKVKAVIADWKKRIVPLIVKAVKTANLAATGVHLEVKEDHTSVIEADNLGHPMPPLPNITIAATRSSRKTIAGMLAGAPPMAAEVLPNIRVSVERDGRIKINPTNCRIMASRGPFLPEQFDEGQIERDIGGFVEDVALNRAKA